MGIRVLCADDSRPVLNMLVRLLSSDPAIEVVWRAENGEEAVHNARVLEPDVITLDLKMPGMDGLQALRRIRTFTSIPVIVVSSYTQPSAKATLEALEAGAFDFIPKPTSGRPEDLFKMRDELMRMVKAAYESSSSKGEDLAGESGEGKAEPKEVYEGSADHTDQQKISLGILSEDEISCFEAIGIGSSTGGPLALAKILTLLPDSFPWPIFIVQHMPPYFTSFFAEKLDSKCALKVKEVKGEEWVETGNVYIASGGSHMKVKKFRGGLKLLLDDAIPPIFGIRPSVDILFSSMASNLGSKAMGILLSGMGHDGVEGLMRMKERGAVTVVQDRNSSLIYGMPGRALKVGAAKRVVKLQDIPRFIYDAARFRAVKCKSETGSSNSTHPEGIQ